MSTTEEWTILSWRGNICSKNQEYTLLAKTWTVRNWKVVGLYNLYVGIANTIFHYQCIREERCRPQFFTQVLHSNYLWRNTRGSADQLSVICDLSYIRLSSDLRNKKNDSNAFKRCRKTIQRPTITHREKINCEISLFPHGNPHHSHFAILSRRLDERESMSIEERQVICHRFPPSSVGRARVFAKGVSDQLTDDYLNSGWTASRGTGIAKKYAKNLDPLIASENLKYYLKWDFPWYRAYWIAKILQQSTPHSPTAF